MFERYDEPLLSPRDFLRRVIRSGLIGAALLGIPLLIGVIGYMGLAGLAPVDAFPTAGAKIFAGLYALFAGVFYLIVAGVILAPFLHRVLHRLHLAEGDRKDSSSG